MIRRLTNQSFQFELHWNRDCVREGSSTEVNWGQRLKYIKQPLRCMLALWKFEAERDLRAHG